MNATVTDDKPLAINIAAYITSFPTLEVLLQGAFEQALGGSGTWSDTILHHVQSISTRIDIVEDFIRSCRAGTPLAESILPLFQRMRDANTYRNLLAHGLIVSNEGEPHIVSNMFARKKTFKQQPLKASEVLSRFHELEQLQLDFMHALGFTPPGFPRKFQR